MSTRVVTGEPLLDQPAEPRGLEQPVHRELAVAALVSEGEVVVHLVEVTARAGVLHEGAQGRGLDADHLVGAHRRTRVPTWRTASVPSGNRNSVTKVRRARVPVRPLFSSTPVKVSCEVTSSPSRSGRCTSKRSPPLIHPRP